MPWPLSSSVRPKPRPASSGDILHDIGGLALEDTGNDSGFHDRRTASLDIARPFNGNVKAVQDDAKRARRSSFPRLALPSWRTKRAIGDDSAIELDGAVELVSGHATPYSANGLRGGFVPDDISLSSSRGGSSIRSGSIHSSLYEQDSMEDYNSAEGNSSLRTGGSSRTRVMVSPFLTPVDSGFGEFGPDSEVQEELQKHEKAGSVGSQAGQMRLSENATTTLNSAISENSMASGSKRRSKGWFSFSSSNNGPVTPTAEDSKQFLLEDQNVAGSDRASSGLAAASSPQQQSDRKVAGSSKAAIPAKGRLNFGSRRRGNSEVSMKNIGDE